MVTSLPSGPEAQLNCDRGAVAGNATRNSVSEVRTVWSDHETHETHEKEMAAQRLAKFSYQQALSGNRQRIFDDRFLRVQRHVRHRPPLRGTQWTNLAFVFFRVFRVFRGHISPFRSGGPAKL